MNRENLVKFLDSSSGSDRRHDVCIHPLGMCVHDEKVRMAHIGSCKIEMEA